MSAVLAKTQPTVVVDRGEDSGSPPQLSVGRIQHHGARPSTETQLRLNDPVDVTVPNSPPSYPGQHSAPASVPPWNEWDEAKFEIKSRSLRSASESFPSSSPNIPQMISRVGLGKIRRLPSLPLFHHQEKGKAVADEKSIDAAPHTFDNDPDGCPPPSDEGASLVRPFSMLSVDRRTPPPVFESVGSGMDCPAYEEVISSAPGNSHQSSPAPVPTTTSHRPRVLPPPPIQVTRPRYQQQRPRFDPMTAYSRSKPASDSVSEDTHAASFYNSAVSPHLSTSSQRSATPKEHQHSRHHRAKTSSDLSATTRKTEGTNADLNLGRRRTVSIASTSSSYSTNPPVNPSPNRGWGSFQPNR